MDKNAICWNCDGFFEYDSEDLRPNIWHKCPDGILTATKNPNLKVNKYRYTPLLLSPYELKLQQKKALNKMLKGFYG